MESESGYVMTKNTDTVTFSLAYNSVAVSAKIHIAEFGIKHSLINDK